MKYAAIAALFATAILTVFTPDWGINGNTAASIAKTALRFSSAGKELSFVITNEDPTFWSRQLSTKLSPAHNSMSWSSTSRACLTDESSAHLKLSQSQRRTTRDRKRRIDRFGGLQPFLA
jgi:hypothetical protein